MIPKNPTTDFSSQKSHHFGNVRRQYETFPYPPRNPEDEKKRLICRLMDSLAKINHYCFKGKQDFKNSFRVLIAGGGTGDSTICLAEQLKDTNAQIVHLDISSSSTEITKKRSQIRGLANIEWIHDSLLNLPKLGLGKFDYINCAGVLHHLENPSRGLNILKNSLKETGAIGTMVYAKYGRTAIYQMQQLMRLTNDYEPDLHIQLQNTKAILDSLPDTNWFKRSEDLCPLIKNRNEAEIVDALLHPQDRAYTVLQLYELINKCGLNLIDFTEDKAHYKPQTFIKDPALLQKINQLPIQKQQAIAELVSGRLTKHTFYASHNTDTIADPYDLENIPFFYQLTSAEQFYNATKNKPPGSALEIKYSQTDTAKIVVGKYTKYLFKYLNNNTSLKKCSELIKKEEHLQQQCPSDQEILHEFKDIYDVFNLMDVMLLRHLSIPPLPRCS